MEDFETLLTGSAKAHGHLCPGQVVGVRTAMLGCRLIGLDEPSNLPQIKMAIKKNQHFNQAICSINPAVVLADEALVDGSIDKLVNVLTNAMAKGIRDRFKHTNETQKHANESVESGREFVESYVVFTHYVEGLHADIKGKSGHHGEGSDVASGHDH
jgi:hypothetical protein